MLPNPKPLTIDEVVLDWGLAETATRLRKHGVDAALIARVQKRAHTPADAQIIIRAIRAARHIYLGHFVENPYVWYEAQLSLDEVRMVRLNRYFAEHPKYHALTTLEGLSRFDEEYQIPGYDPKKEVGRPVIVSREISGPWLILEGTHRLCTRIRHAAGQPNQLVTVIIGAGPNITAWNCWKE